MNTNTAAVQYTVGWGASVSDENGPVTDPAAVLEAASEWTGIELGPDAIEVEDAEIGAWLVPLTEDQEAELAEDGWLEITATAADRVLSVTIEMP